jgi:putative NADH-flavin reductase
MKITLFGASGMLGSRILDELLSRGHQVTAVARNASRILAHDSVTAMEGDLLDTAFAARAASGADAVISAYSPGLEDGLKKRMIDSTRSLIRTLEQAGVRRLVMVGGAGSLLVSSGKRLMDIPEFPAAWKSIAMAHLEALQVLEQSDLDWTYFSPAAFIQPGERTGKFRLGTTNLVSDSKGVSRISAEDYAVALVDELEQPKHLRRQFTAAY